MIKSIYSKYRRECLLILCMLISALIFGLLPLLFNATGIPLTDAGTRMFAVFVAVILALIITPYPLSMIAGLGLVVLVLSRSMYPSVCHRLSDGSVVDCKLCTQSSGEDQCDIYGDLFLSALSGFADEVVWLVFAAFHLGAAVEHTHLGRRVSLLLVRIFGRSVLGMGYSIFLSELVLGPFVPSNTARGGSIVLPIATSMSVTLGSTPAHLPRKRGGEFMILCAAHANLVASALYPIGMAANPLVVAKSKEILGVDFGYGSWILGAIVPALFTTALLPWVLFRLSFYSQQDTYLLLDSQTSLDEDVLNISPPASPADDEEQLNMIAVREKVSHELSTLGPPSKQEWKLIFVLIICLTLWITKDQTGLNSALVAFTAVIVLLFTNVLEWDQVARNSKAWDSCFWLSILIMMAGQLRKVGAAQLIGETVSDGIARSGVGSVGASILLALVYFLSMYMFSSLTGHIVALVGPFFAAGKDLKCPPLLLIAFMAYFSTLCGCMTNYSSGPIVLCYSQGYISRPRWFAIGALVALFHLSTYLTVGLLWWKILGWW